MVLEPIAQHGTAAALQISFSDPNVQAALIGASVIVIVLPIGRFVWRNHSRSSKNSSRLNRYGRTLFGDDDDATHDGIAQQVEDLHAQGQRLEERVGRVEDKVDRLCKKLDA